MARLLLLLVIVVVVALLLRKLLRGVSTKRAEAPEATAEAPAPEAKLVRCVECGAFVPRAEALPAPNGNGFRCGGAGCSANS